MSHVSTIETVINDLDALKQAAESLGLEFVEGQKTYRYYGRWANDYHEKDAAYKHGFDPKQYGQCSHALRVKDQPGAYEVGVVKKEDGTYGLLFDHWCAGYGLMAKIGPKGSFLSQAYTKVKVETELKKKGFKITKLESGANGSIKMTLEGPVKL